MKKVNVKSLIIFVGLLLCTFLFGLGIMMVSNSQRNIEKVEIIAIRNGNNGELIELDEADSNSFVSEFNAIQKRISGINLWRLGYDYKILLNEELTKDITVRGDNTISAGIFDYKTDESVIEMIEKYIE